MVFFKSPKDMCTPAQIYFYITALLVFATLVFDMMTLTFPYKPVFHGAIVFIWACCLAWMCDKGYKTVSWILVSLFTILPTVIILVALVVLAVTFGAMTKEERAQEWQKIMSKEAAMK